MTGEHRWSDAARSAWGKSDRDSDAWLPLVQHLEDSAAVARFVCNDWISPNVLRHIAEGLPAVADVSAIDTAVTVVAFLAGIHDVGKCTPAFAVQHQGLLARMHDAGLASPMAIAGREAAHHTSTGYIIVQNWIRERYGDGAKDVGTALAAVVGGHHGTPRTAPDLSIRHSPGLIGDDLWTITQFELLDGMALRTGAGKVFASWSRDWAQVRIPPSAQLILTSLVIVADWLASDADRFPYPGTLAAPPPDGLTRAERAWIDLAMPSMWRADRPPRDPDSHMAQRFPGKSLYPAQRALVEAAWEVDRPELLILEAPMGQGKTEAAMLAAEILASKFDLGGVFFGLPTMATSNAMFARVLAWMRAMTLNPTSVFLAHGKAQFNDDLAELAHLGQVAAVYDVDDESRKDRSPIVVQEWLRGRKKGPLASFVVGTIDQALMMALQTKHVALRHLALATKVVVIDEVHAADDYMRQYLCRALDWLGSLNIPVILLSATLPAWQRDELQQAYRVSQSSQPSDADTLAQRLLSGQQTEAPDEFAYPLIHAGRQRITPTRATSGDTLVAVHQLDDQEVSALLERTLGNGGCAAVICNTVRRAQECYAELRETFGPGVILVHSRFLAHDRQRREADLVARLGPNGDRPQRLVVVGTQVLEQSLDIDVDVMVTDLAPIDLILQRIGRLHRHARPDRHGPESPVLYVRGCDWSADPPVPDAGAVRVYGLSLLLRASAVLFGAGLSSSIPIPAAIPALIARAYDPALVVPASWTEDLELADLLRDAKAKSQVRKAQDFLLKSPRGLPGLLPLFGGSLADERGGQRQVRDTEDGIEVACVQRRGTDLVGMAGSAAAGQVVPEYAEPPPWQAKSIAASSIRLPRGLSNPRIASQVIKDLEDGSYPAWQTSAWLSGELVLTFDEAGTATVAGHRLTYTPEEGLIVMKEVDSASSEPGT